MQRTFLLYYSYQESPIQKLNPLLFLYLLIANGTQPVAMADLETIRTQNPERIVPRLGLRSAQHLTYELQVCHLLSDPNLPPGKPKDAGTAMTGV